MAQPQETYNHQYVLGFSIAGSTHPQGEDVTEQMIYEAIIARAKDLLAVREGREAIGAPVDTYKEQPCS